MTMAVTR